MNKPDFIHIGPGRTGTTFIFKMLDQHPQIELPDQKEINYFIHNYEKGDSWYESIFPDVEGTLTGDFSNLYFYDKEAVKRIASNLPKAKVICVLRNPFDRTISNFRYQQRSGNMDARLDFETALQKYPDLGEQYHFSELLKHHRELLGNRLYIGIYDEMKDDPKNFFKDIFRFLEVDEDFVPEGLHKKVNTAVSLKMAGSGKVFRFIADMLRAMGLTAILDRFKNSESVQKLIYKKPERGRIAFPDGLKVKINRDIDSLEQLVQKELKHWKRR